MDLKKLDVRKYKIWFQKLSKKKQELFSNIVSQNWKALI